MTKAEVMMDLKTTPLGLGPGEGILQVPFNAAATTPRVYVINHSATRMRRYVKIGVSERRGIQEALLADRQLQKVHNVETLRQNVREGYDMNVYDQKIEPVIFVVRHDGHEYLIPPAASTDEAPEPQLIPEGAWDQYLGNYERMNAVNKAGQPDMTARTEEQSRVSLRWMRSNNPVCTVTVNGESQERDNPFGCLEFVRVVEKQAPQKLDMPFLSALELVEA